jgi:hypothetical protein
MLTQTTEFVWLIYFIYYQSLIQQNCWRTLSFESGKPLPSLVGETYELVDISRGVRLLCEHVPFSYFDLVPHSFLISMHGIFFVCIFKYNTWVQVREKPSLSLMQVDAKHNWKLVTSFGMTNKFNGRYFEITPRGKMYLNNAFFVFEVIKTKSNFWSFSLLLIVSVFAVVSRFLSTMNILFGIELKLLLIMWLLEKELYIMKARSRSIFFDHQTKQELTDSILW